MCSAKTSRKEAEASPPLVVGIGASAGANEALHAMLNALPNDCSMSFVVILHITPDADYLLPEVLSKYTRLPVQEIANKTRLQPGHVYTAPGGCTVSLKDGLFSVANPKDAAERHQLIDYFFASLAKDQGEKAVAIILSGTGNDGATGLQDISKAGGMTLVQAPTTAIQPEMPQNAIETGAADHVLSPVNITEELLAYAQHMQFSIGKEQYEELHVQIEKYLSEICRILHEVTGHNFRHYKVSTLTRRIQRRVQVMRVSSAKEYVERLGMDVSEVRHLFNDLLIGVTAFFRDPDAFAGLANEVFPKLFENHKAGDAIRIWVPGCATGEEAYTLAILMQEYLEKSGKNTEVQIFATDIDEDALRIARQGVYPHHIADEVSPEQLKRFFVKKAQHYQVDKATRSMVLFSVHNLINDPPFSKLDLVSCRNLIIYLGSHLQKKLIPLFHYALKPGGFLFLGPSENISSHRELFRPVNAKYRISQRLPTAVPSGKLISGYSGPPTLVKPPNVPAASETDTYLLMQRIVLDEFAPKALVMDGEGQIICASGNLEKYLTVSAGAFQNNAMRLVREGLRVGLRTTLAEAVKTRRQVVHNGLSLRTKEGIQRVMLTVQPMPHLGDEAGLFMVVFQDVGLPIREESAYVPASEEAGALIEQLERELLTAREDLERTVQDLEAANEELKSSNEELLSMNEELQSANEELETSKEEVQLANDNLNRANTDLENLLASTQIATIFLDNQANVRRVTPSASIIYNLLPSDAGRSLSHFTHKAKHMPPLPPVNTIRASEKAIEDEVEMHDGTWYMRRILPYRTHEGVYEGILLMFTEITKSKRSEIALRKSEERLRLALAASKLGVAIWNIADDSVKLTPRAAEIFGVGALEISWPHMQMLVHPEDRDRVEASLRHSLDKNVDYMVEYRVIRPDKKHIWVLSTGHGEYDEHGKPLAMTRLVRDITERKRAEAMLRESEQRFRLMADSAPVFIWMSDTDKKATWFNKPWRDFVGRPLEAETGDGWAGSIHPDDYHATLRTYKSSFDAREPFRMEFRVRRHDGEYRWLLDTGIPLYDAEEEFTGYIGSCIDITDHKVALEALQDADQRKDEFLAILAHELRNPLAPLSNGLQVMRMAGTSNYEMLMQALDMMERQISHMVRLVDDLLDVSRITRGQIELHKQQLEVQEIVKNALEISSPNIKAKGHSLTVSLPDHPVHVIGDATRLSQVIANLLNNAAKYTPNGGKIELSALTRDSKVIISIKDNGIGIPRDMLPKIFDVFVQVDTAMERAEGGLGIGLTLVRKLLELHGGSIEARSAGPGKGSEFIITLPQH